MAQPARKGPSPRRLFAAGATVAATLLFLMPIGFLVCASLAEPGRALESPLAIPETLHWDNYARALRAMGGYDLGHPWRGFLRIVANTVAITVSCIAGQLLTCSLAGFAFARLRFRGRDALFVLVLATLMLPLQVTAIPQFVLFQGLGWIDTFLPLVVPAFLGGAPFFIFLFRQFFLTIPRDVFEAARLDGCGWGATYWRVALPLARPVLATVAVFTFLGVWNDLWTPLIYLSSPENQTLTLALAGFSRTYRVAVEFLMAASGVILLPGLVVYLAAQRLFLRRVELRAAKG